MYLIEVGTRAQHADALPGQAVKISCDSGERCRRRPRSRLDDGLCAKPESTEAAATTSAVWRGGATAFSRRGRRARRRAHMAWIARRSWVRPCPTPSCDYVAREWDRIAGP